MIRLEENKLIIEIKTDFPLQILGEYQNGLITALNLIFMHEHDNYTDSRLEDGIRFTTELLREMQLSSDQSNILYKALSKKEVTDFNHSYK